MSGIFAEPRFVRRWAIRLGLVWFAMLYFRVAFVSRQEFERAEVARAAGQVEVAIAHYRRSARHVAPPFDASGRAYDALFAAGRAAEERHDPRTALSAYRAIRGSIVASRPLGTFQGDRLESADARIAALVAANDRTAALRDRSPELVRRMHRRWLQDEPHERWLGLVLTVVGFLLFVGASHELVARGHDLDDRPVRETVVRAALSITVGFCVFVVGLLIT